jgi:small subunit ribosomal protein S17
MAATKTSTKSSAPAKKAETPAATTESKTGTKIGVVESDVRLKTRKVVVAYLDKHPKYGKYVRKRTVLHVHDENNESKNGDVVEVAPCRPLSKTKSWKLVRIVEKRAELAAAIKSVKEVQ